MKSLTNRHNQKNRGQVGLIVLLIMVVVLTLGISIVSRSSQDVTQSRQEEETSRVFDAAEAGIEDALSRDFSTLTPIEQGSVDTITDINVNYTIDSLTSLEVRLTQGHVAEVNLQTASLGDTLRVDWARNQDCASNAASVVIAIINQSGGNTTVRREGYSSCVTTDNFTVANPGVGDFFSSQTISLQGGDVLARIRTIYNDTELRATGSWSSFPVQNYRIHSKAVSDIGYEARTVEVNRTLPVAPSVFDYVLFSGFSIAK